MAGAPLRAVQTLLGHTQREMTLRYSHLGAAHLQEAVERLVAPNVLEMTFQPPPEQPAATITRRSSDRPVLRKLPRMYGAPKGTILEPF
jgi:hypothetical protein